MTDEAKIGQLLKPRVKVIALWPWCKNHNEMKDQPKVGDIFEVSPGGSISNDAMTVMHVDKYPHLFERIHWHQERKIEELPEYVKWDNGAYPEANTIEKVAKWVEGPFGLCAKVPSQVNEIRAGYFMPATSADYNSYISSTDKKEKV